jgi:hypothetical protein
MCVLVYTWYLRYIYMYISFYWGIKLIPTFFIAYFMKRIVVGYFSDLQIGFGCTEHKQENIFPQY